MSGEVRVDVTALARARQEHHALARDFAALQGERAGADLPDGALGKLGASQEIQAAFDARWQGLGDALDALTEIYDNIGDGLAATADGYTTTDESVAALHRTLGTALP